MPKSFPIYSNRIMTNIMKNSYINLFAHDHKRTKIILYIIVKMANLTLAHLKNPNQITINLNDL